MYNMLRLRFLGQGRQAVNMCIYELTLYHMWVGGIQTKGTGSSFCAEKCDKLTRAIFNYHNYLLLLYNFSLCMAKYGI